MPSAIYIINKTVAAASCLASFIALFRLSQTRPRYVITGILINVSNIIAQTILFTWSLAPKSSFMIQSGFYHGSIAFIGLFLVLLHITILKNYSVMSDRITPRVFVIIRVITGVLFTLQFSGIVFYTSMPFHPLSFGLVNLVGSLWSFYMISYTFSQVSTLISLPVFLAFLPGVLQEKGTKCERSRVGILASFFDICHHVFIGYRRLYSLSVDHP